MLENNPTLDNMKEEINQTSQQVTDKILYFTNVAVSAATKAVIATISNSKITTDSVVLECIFANPKYIATDITWTTSASTCTFTGTATAATTMKVVIGNSNIIS